MIGWLRLIQKNLQGKDTTLVNIFKNTTKEEEQILEKHFQNMKNFIRDIRKDLGLPRLPFVIGIMGQNGFKEATGNMAIVKAAQASMNEVEEFRGNVRAIPTDVYWDKKADQAYPTWRDNFEEWKKIGSDRPYHYLGSTIFFSRVGRAFGGDMLKLLTNN